MRRWIRRTGVGLASLVLEPSLARAGTWTWDPDPASGIQGGSGNWNKTDSLWDNGTARVTWGDATDTLALFAGTQGGTVNVRTRITTGSLQFDTPGYTLTTAASDLRIEQGNIVANADATIAVPLITPGVLVKTGAAALTLNSANSFGSNLRITQGWLGSTSDACLGKTSNAIELAGGGFRYTGSSDWTLPSARALQVTATGGSVELNAGAMQLTSAGQFTGTGTLQKLGDGTLKIAAANSAFAGQISLQQGALTLSYPQAINARPVTLCGGTLNLLGDSPADFGSELTVVTDSTVWLHVNTVYGIARTAHHVARVAIEAPATLRVACGSSYDYLATNTLDLAGTLRIIDNAVRVEGSISGSGIARLEVSVGLPERFNTGLLFSGAVTRNVGLSVVVPDTGSFKGIVGVESGGTLNFDGAWQANGAAAQSYVVLRNGSRFVLTSSARVSTVPVDGGPARPWDVLGTGTADIFELAPGFLADRAEAGALGALNIQSATLRSHSSSALPRTVRTTSSGTAAAGGISFSGTSGARWVVADSPHTFDAQVSLAGPVTLELHQDLTHAGVVTHGFDAQFQAPVAGATVTKTGSGSLNLAGSQGYVSGTVLNVQAGTVRFETDPGAGFYDGHFTRATDGSVISPAPQATLAVNVSSAASSEFTAPVARLASLSLNSGAGARILPGGVGQRAVVTGSLTLAGSAQVDLADGRWIIDYTGTTPFATIQGLIRSGYNIPSARWQGAGLISSLAAADASLAVGVAEAAALFNFATNPRPMFGPVEVDSTSVLVRLTRTGDANLDGLVNFIDLVAVAQNYNSSSARWTQGDFNYDGIVNFTDLAAVAQNYNSSFTASPVPGSMDFARDWSTAQNTVPEPVNLALIAGGALLLSRRRTSIPVR